MGYGVQQPVTSATPRATATGHAAAGGGGVRALSPEPYFLRVAEGEAHPLVARMSAASPFRVSVFRERARAPPAALSTGPALSTRRPARTPTGRQAVSALLTIDRLEM